MTSTKNTWNKVKIIHEQCSIESYKLGEIRNNLDSLIFTLTDEIGFEEQLSSDYEVIKSNLIMAEKTLNKICFELIKKADTIAELDDYFVRKDDNKYT